ncbi:MAG: histidine kinase [Erysipelotrichaceae bacterium]|nr:histidine kinase [Erysipelotrichaceae bacterium]
MKLSSQERLRKRILYIGFLIVIAVIVILYFFSAYYDHFNLNKKITTNQLIIKQQFQEVFTNLQESTLRFQNDTRLHQYFLKQDDAYHLYQELSRLNTTNLKHQMVVFDEDKTLIFSSFQNAFDTIDHSYQMIFLKNLDQHVIDTYHSNIENSNNHYLVYTGKVKNLGYVMYYIKDVDLLSFLQTKMLDNFLIIDEKDNIIISSNSFLNQSIHQVKQNTLRMNHSTYLVKQTAILPQLQLITLVRKDTLFNVESLVFIALFSFLLSAVLIHYYSKKISINTTTSLELFLQQLQQIKTQNVTHLTMHTDDEFETIANSINELLEEIKTLADNNQKLLILGQQIELKQLQAQFNPHFLYNTLETLRCLLFVDVHAANDLILKLTKILRYSITQTNQQVLFIDDFNYIQNFLDIMKLRFEDRFNYYIKIDERCHQVEIPKLILQPLIENSIKHNFKTKDHLTIWISADMIDEDLVIELEDNGEGMSPKQLHHLLSNLDKDTNHIGLSNVYKRLQLIYKEDAELTIHSYQTIGTKISIRIRSHHV